MIGEFPDSVIILAGCDTTSSERLSQALVDRGASVVVGWSDTVLYDKNDTLILALMQKVLVNGEDVSAAISSVKEQFSHYLDPINLKYYPEDSV